MDDCYKGYYALALCPNLVLHDGGYPDIFKVSAGFEAKKSARLVKEVAPKEEPLLRTPA